MSAVLDRLKKKRGYPVQIEGEEFFVRSLTIGELRRLEKVPTESKTGFLVGCALCDDANGGQSFPKEGEEADEVWSARVSDLIADVPTETIRALSEGVASISKTPRLEAVAKN